jgi:hypothetical protein
MDYHVKLDAHFVIVMVYTVSLCLGVPFATAVIITFPKLHKRIVLLHLKALLVSLFLVMPVTITSLAYWIYCLYMNK